MTEIVDVNVCYRQYMVQICNIFIKMFEKEYFGA